MNGKAKQLSFKNLGRIGYADGWRIQEEIFAKTVADKIDLRSSDKTGLYPKNHIICCEHNPVYTLGKSGKIENLLLTDDQLADRGIDFHKINRGGDITFHGPGQIVVYPILDLDQFFTDIHKYLRYLEEAVILTLSEYGIKAGRISGLTGVWLDGEFPEKARKICAMGIKCSRWVTMHGLAFNVNTDLMYFEHIIPCGIDDKAVTSMEQELGSYLDLDEVRNKLLSHLGNLFGWELINKFR